MVPHWPREAQKNPPHAGRVARILATTLTRGTAWTQKRSAPRGRPTGNRRRPWRQRSRRLLGGSGVSREAPAPFCERPEVKLLRPTRQMAAIHITRADFHGEWNYTIQPSNRSKTAVNP